MDDKAARELIKRLVERLEAANLAKVVMNRALTLNPYPGMEQQLATARAALADAVHAEYQAVYAALDNPGSDWQAALRLHLDTPPAVRGM